MTWLFEGAAAAVEVPVDLLAEGLFAPRCRGAVLPLEFGPAFPPVAAPGQEGGNEAARAETLETQERARQVRLMVDAAREEAAAETRALLEQDFAERLERERRRVMAVLELFGEERARWFRRAEGEMVELTLAVARCVLRRELQADPMCLREIAVTAVDRVAEASGVVLRVDAASVADWRSTFAGRRDLEVVADAAVPAGSVVVDTSFGRVELGLEVQLQEIAERFREQVGGPRRVLVSAEAMGAVA